ncbi:hypothetical protein MSAN_00646800 [Mycena sanguinolenta]|uniref:Uncharacterized protein n=1 Tax=Mycena sanguinolenta TaxID=230812 RepID=A0A8H6Z0X1_9AGAR|nr:hypothetical protein MSAN_00646800 [Mycena sanguinolenta]
MLTSSYLRAFPPGVQVFNSAPCLLRRPHVVLCLNTEYACAKFLQTHSRRVSKSPATGPGPTTCTRVGSTSPQPMEFAVLAVSSTLSHTSPPSPRPSTIHAERGSRPAV